MRPTNYVDLKKKIISHYRYANKDANHITNERICIFFNSLEIEDGYNNINNILIKVEGLLTFPGVNNVMLREATYLFYYKLLENVV